MPSQDLLASQIASEERKPSLTHPGKENISFSASASSSSSATATAAATTTAVITAAAGKTSTGDGKARRKPAKVGRVDVEALVQKRTVLKDVWNEILS